MNGSIVVTMRGGNLVSVWCTDPAMDVTIFDLDDVTPESEQELYDLTTDMPLVY